ncbi:hypothetical protein A2W49_01520 [Candidatus Roizmanbacteria bacterium RIFCSPHIGHO2_12_41_18]|nr:MAG: hypothetical protein A2W49_01520 [Candidatus Roizmanbacteria bacterium RIFCSPHIGHO2_12_41_18]
MASNKTEVSPRHILESPVQRLRRPHGESRRRRLRRHSGVLQKEHPGIMRGQNSLEHRKSSNVESTKGTIDPRKVRRIL